MTIVNLIHTYPQPSIVIIAGLVSLFITLVNYFVLDKEKVRSSREKQKNLREEMKLHKSNPQKMMEINKELMNDAMQNMGHSFKPMIITLVPMFVVLAWIRKVFTGTLNGWIWWYIISAVVFSIVFRKVFKLP